MLSLISNAQESASSPTVPQVDQSTQATIPTEKADVSNELSELVVIPNQDFVADDVKSTTDGLEYQSVTIKSEYTLGTETQTDFMVKQSSEDTTNIERELDTYRTGFLHNLENAPSVTKDKPEIKKSSIEEINTARNKINQNKSIIKEAKFLVNNEQKENTLKKLQQDKKLKEVKDQPVKKAETETPPTTSKQAPTQEVTPGEPQEKPVTNPKKLNYWMDKLNPTIKAEAQNQISSSYDWAPDFSSVNFFDSDEVGTYVHSNWSTTSSYCNAQPSVTHGNGRMYVAIKTPANKVAVGNFDSNGNDPKPFVVIGDTTQSPTIEFYYGRIYVGIIGANNTPLYKFSADNGVTWSAWTSIGGNVLSMDFERLGNSLYVGARGTNNRLYMNQINNGVNTWTGWVVKGTQTTIDKPVLAAHENRIYFGFRAVNNQALVNRNALNWSDTNNKLVLNITNSSFGMASTGGTKLCFIFKANINQLIQGCTHNDLASPPFLINANQISDYAPAMAKDWNLSQIAVDPSQTIMKRSLGFSLNTRGYLTEMVWTEIDSNDFQTNSTFEPKITLGNGPNSNYSTYLDKDTTAFPQCLPIPSYWTTSLPFAYLDTRVLGAPNNILQGSTCDNDTDTVSYVIGTGRAGYLTANKSYINYYVDGKGSNNTVRYSYTYQKGEMRPDWCVLSSMCSTLIDSGVWYGCNSNSGYTWCSFMNSCEGICEGFFAKNIASAPLITQNNYPYWYETFNK
jgi:hypothetical protein